MAPEPAPEGFRPLAVAAENLIFAVPGGGEDLGVGEAAFDQIGSEVLVVGVPLARRGFVAFATTIECKPVGCGVCGKGAGKLAM